MFLSRTNRLREKGVRTRMFDVSVTAASDIIAEAFRFSHLVFASTTYNAGLFVTMEALLCDLTAHNIQNRTVAIIENGSWAATSGSLIREHLGKCRDIRFIEDMLSLKSALKADQLSIIEAMAEAIVASFPDSACLKRGGGADAVAADTDAPAATVDPASMFRISYGLFVLTAKDGGKDNGCIVNTVTQITQTPLKIAIAVNKANYTESMIAKTREFNVSVLSTSAPFRLFQKFGFQSGRDVDKFADVSYDARGANGIRYIPECANAMISARVVESYDFGTHTLFIGAVTEGLVLSDEPSVTYQYYFDHIKPKPQRPKDSIKGFVCKICGFVYEGDAVPGDFICPLCKHGPEDFEAL